MKTISLLGYTLKVKIVTAEELSKKGKDCVALYDSDDMVIYLRDDLSAYWKMYYLFHEATHHVLHMNGADQTMSDEMLEVVCQTNATMCMQLIPQIPARNQAQMRKAPSI